MVATASWPRYHDGMSAFEVVLFPYGNAEGFPALRMTPESCRRPRPDPVLEGVRGVIELANAYTGAAADLSVEDIALAVDPFWFGNCWAIWLDGFEWNSRTAEIVDAFTNHERWAQRNIVATVDVRRPETALQRCTLVADATQALATATTDAEALAIIERMHVFEGVTDLVVSLRYPAGPTVLDRLHAAVLPVAGGTVYAPPDAPWLPSLRSSVFHARSPWAMRIRSETPHT